MKPVPSTRPLLPAATPHGRGGAPPHGRGLVRRRLGEGAFTIMEVMMAAIVMAFAITTSITVMQRAFLAVDAARGVTYAAQIMQTELEKMRLSPWGNGLAGVGSGTTGVSAYPTTATNVDIDSSFTGDPIIGAYIRDRFTLTRTAATAGHTNMIQVTLTVTWRGYDGRTLSRSYITYYGQGGLYDYFSS
jgi:hypothetical protein